MLAASEIATYVIPIGIVSAALILGILAERILLGRLKAFSERTRWKGDDIIFLSLRGMIPLWSVAITGRFLLLRGDFSPATSSLIDKALLVVIILSFTMMAARIAAGFLRSYGQEGTGVLPSASIFANMARVSVFLIGFLIISDTLGVSITPIITALGVGGLAVALALQDTLSNLFAGLHILASRQIKPGNYVKLDSGEEGYVVDVTWRTTTMRTLPNNLVVIPNAKLASAIVMNYHLPATDMAVLVNLSVGYRSDLACVERVTIEVARDIMRTVAGGVPTFEPFIRYHTFGDSGIGFTVILRGGEFTDQYLIKHEFIKRLHQRYRAEAIEIPFPQQDIHIVEYTKTAAEASG